MKSLGRKLKWLAMGSTLFLETCLLMQLLGCSELHLHLHLGGSEQSKSETANEVQEQFERALDGETS